MSIFSSNRPSSGLLSLPPFPSSPLPLRLLNNFAFQLGLGCFICPALSAVLALTELQGRRYLKRLDTKVWTPATGPQKANSYRSPRINAVLGFITTRPLALSSVPGLSAVACSPQPTHTLHHTDPFRLRHNRHPTRRSRPKPSRAGICNRAKVRLLVLHGFCLLGLFGLLLL